MKPSREYILGWLRGYFDGEGSVANTRKFYGPTATRKWPRRCCYHYVSAANTDEAIHRVAVNFLKRLSIQFTDNGYKPKVSPKGTDRSWVYRVRIGRLDALERFASLVGFTSRIKKQKLKETLKCYRNHKFHVYHLRGNRHGTTSSLAPEPCKRLR